MRRNAYFGLISGVVLAFASCSKPTAIAVIRPLGKDGVTGQVKFVQEKNGRVYMTAVINAPTSRTRAIHIYEKGDCSAPDGASAGYHWNPLYHKHGKWGRGEFHKGDIGNIRINTQGKGFYGMITGEWCVGCPDFTKDIVGKAIIIHEKADNFVTQPSGSAGARKGCGVIRIK